MYYVSRRQEHIAAIRKAIVRGEREIAAMYRRQDGDVGDIVAMEEYSSEYHEACRQQKARQDMLERLEAKERRELL